MKEKPKYIALEDYIKDQISKGILKPGDQLLTENELAKEFNISRLTVNKALSRLAFDNYIERIPRRGSFVLFPSFTPSINTVGSFTEYMNSIHVKGGFRLIEYKFIAAKECPKVANILEISAESSLIHYFVKLRTANDKPISLMTSYVPASIVPNFDISVLSGSLYEYFDKCNLPRLGVKCKFSAIIPDEKLMGYLNVDDRCALLKNDHVTYTYGRKPLEYCEAVYIGSDYSYDFEQYSEEINNVETE